MERIPEERHDGQLPLNESDCEDNVPLARLRQRPEGQHNNVSSSDEDEPLARLRVGSELLREVSSDDEFYYNSDNDPEFEPGKCEVSRCREDVWAACEDCSILVCYDHFMEEVRSCDKHGKVKVKTKQKKKVPVRCQGEETDQGSRPIIDAKDSSEYQGARKELMERETGKEVETLSRAVEVEETREEEDELGEVQDIAVEQEQDNGEEGEAKQLRGRKRKRSEADWRRNIRKRLRNSGKSYESSRGKEIKGRSIKPGCSETCALKCSTKFNENERKDIFEDFWKTADKREQSHFILRHVQEVGVKRKRVGSDKRNTTFSYSFYKNEKKEKVCRVYFLNTLDIRQDIVYRTIRRSSTSGVLNKSFQGKHEGHKKFNESTLQTVRDHISSFKAIESHYCRADSKRKYLDPSLSVAAMYRLYCAACEENGKEKVSEDKYRSVFCNDFNLGFHRPKKDQCEVCIAHKHNQNEMTEEEMMKFEEHIKNKEIARRIKDEAKIGTSTSPTQASCAFDLEQILLCPHGQSSSFFYKRRLGVYNLSIYDYKHGDAFCFMWPENEGRRGSNEVATCLYNYLIHQTTACGVKDVHMFSDNCAGQNRNRFVAFALHFACQKLRLDSITHTFLEKGHTETENDSVHSTIERKTRHIELYTPEQWFTAVRTARISKQPYIVREMSGRDFIDFKSMANKVRNLAVDEDGEKIPWSKVRQVIVKADDPEVLLIKTSYGGSPQRLNLNRRKRVSGDFVDAANVQMMKGIPEPGIPEAKKRDLIALCDSGQIPVRYKAFYLSLPICKDTKEDDED